MFKIQNIECHSWDEFKTSAIADLFDGKPFIRSRFLFRGQLDPDWPLVSSYDRWFDAQQLGEAARVNIARELLATFRQEIVNAGLDHLADKSETHVLAMAQHYGLPTRLLDWSESPYIAAFFAFVDVVLSNRRPERVVVWALDTNCYHWSSERGAEIVKLDSPGANLRIRNQEGKFTLLRTPSRSLDDYISQFPHGCEVPLRRILVPSSDSLHALSEMDAMGINPARAYPDLQGFVMAAKLHQRLHALTWRSAGQVGPSA